MSAETIQRAQVAQQAGNLDRAEELYNAVLRECEDDAAARFGLAQVCLQRRRPELAVNLLTPLAVANAPAGVYSNLGIAFSLLDRHAEAVGSFQQAASCSPEDPGVHFNLGNALQRAGQHSEAIEVYTKATRLAPTREEIHRSMANSHRDVGDHESAVRSYQRALRINPRDQKTLRNLGVVYGRMNRPSDAEDCFRQLRLLDPNWKEGNLLLAASLMDQERFDEAEPLLRVSLQDSVSSETIRNRLGLCWIRQNRLDAAVELIESSDSLSRESVPGICELREALRRAGRTADALRLAERLVEQLPDEGLAHNNLGLAHVANGEPATAIACYEKAIELGCATEDIHNNFGVALQALGRTDEALEQFDQALRIQPDCAWAHLNRAFSWFQKGRFREAWHEMEWRRIISRRKVPSAIKPLWDGRSIAGGTILLAVEQGIGDIFQFVRYASEVRNRCDRVVLLCPRKLHKILSMCPGIDEILDPNIDVPPHDAFAPLMSLPGIMGTEQPEFAASDPYIFADPRLVHLWKERLPSKAFQIGIAWQGNREYAGDKLRSVPLAYFESLAAVPGVELISLQIGEGSDQIPKLDGRFHVHVLTPELDRSGDAFTDTAAVMANLDLIVSSDTAIPHLAGAMGCPVWLAVGFAPDWRWFERSRSCSWYPSMLCFGQPTFGDWANVFENMASELVDIVTTGTY